MQNTAQANQTLLTWRIGAWRRWLVWGCVLALIGVAPALPIPVLDDAYWHNLFMLPVIAWLLWVAWPLISALSWTGEVRCTAQGVDISAGGRTTHADWQAISSLHIKRFGLVGLSWSEEPWLAYFHLPRARRDGFLALIQENSGARVSEIRKWEPEPSGFGADDTNEPPLLEWTMPRWKLRMLRVALFSLGTGTWLLFMTTLVTSWSLPVDVLLCLPWLGFFILPVRLKTVPYWAVTELRCTRKGLLFSVASWGARFEMPWQMVMALRRGLLGVPVLETGSGVISYVFMSNPVLAKFVAILREHSNARIGFD